MRTNSSSGMGSFYQKQTSFCWKKLKVMVILYFSPKVCDWDHVRGSRKASSRPPGP